MSKGMKFRLFTSIALLGFAALPLSLSAQGFDISPYAGYIWPQSFGGGVGEFAHNQLLGVRGGAFVGSNFEVGGNYSWNNHFQPKDTNLDSSIAGGLGFPQGKVRANIYEVEFSYHFSKHSMFGSSFRPYLVAAGGGLTTTVSSPNTFVVNVRTVTTPFQTFHFANDVIDNNDTFFTFSYGAGVKAQKLWGPLGFFGDFRGRTVQNFFGKANTWPELSAGLNFAWGE
jgi:hypothetical protein